MNKKKLCIATTILPIALIIIACAMPSSKKEEEEPVVEEPLVPYGYLIEDEDFVTTYKGFYVVRDDQFYSLNRTVSLKNRDEYNFGENAILEAHLFKDNINGQSIYDSELGCMNDDKTLVYYFYTIGDFELLKIEPTDEIRSYGVSKVSLVKLESLGYGFRRQMSGGAGYGNLGNTDSGHGYAPGWINTKEVGKIHVPDLYKELKYQIGDEEIFLNYNLEKDTEVTVSWYEKTDYYEYTCVADSKFFYASNKDVHGVLGDESTGPIEKEGTLTKDGYATYDFSDLEPGTYYLYSDEIVDTDFGEKLFKGKSLFVIE